MSRWWMLTGRWWSGKLEVGGEPGYLNKRGLSVRLLHQTPDAGARTGRHNKHTRLGQSDASAKAQNHSALSRRSKPGVPACTHCTAALIRRQPALLHKPPARPKPAPLQSTPRHPTSSLTHSTTTHSITTSSTMARTKQTARTYYLTVALMSPPRYVAVAVVASCRPPPLDCDRLDFSISRHMHMLAQHLRTSTY